MAGKARLAIKAVKAARKAMKAKKVVKKLNKTKKAVKQTKQQMQKRVELSAGQVKSVRKKGLKTSKKSKLPDSDKLKMSPKFREAERQVREKAKMDLQHKKELLQKLERRKQGLSKKSKAKKKRKK